MTKRAFSVPPRVEAMLAGLLILLGTVLPSATVRAQTYTILHRFGTNPVGAYPVAPLAMDGAGRLIGAVAGGGLAGGGRVFALQQDGSGFTVLKDFSGPDGASPESGLCVTGAVVYGSTARGGFSDQGTLFRLSADGSGFKTIHVFSNWVDGAFPIGRLAQFGTYLYGVTSDGGVGLGTVFRVGTNGTGFTVLHRFTGTDGSYPSGGLLIAGSVAYGVTSAGGASGNGVVFRMNLDGSGFAVLKAFVDSTDGSGPSGGLVLDGGYVYGAALWGGTFGGGTLFQLATNGSQFVVLKEFDVYDGSPPNGDLAVSGSTLFGVTQWGGVIGDGAVFRIEKDGRDFSLVRSFTLATDGAALVGGLVRSGTNLFGVAAEGGPGSAGTLYRLGTDGRDFAVLTSFNPGDGTNPFGCPVVAGATLYGTTAGGGPGARGTIYALGTNGGDYRILKSFSGPYDENPGELTLSGSTLFGATSGGGSYHQGTILRIETNGTGFATLHEFDGTNGRAPLFRLAVAGPLIFGAAYGGEAGSEFGTVFRLGTNGLGFQVLRRFVGPDGAQPSEVIVSGQTLYGTTYGGGAFGQGTVYRMNIDGSGFALLRSFNWSDGANPHAGLTLSGDMLYGVTGSGGPRSEGVVFSMRTDGSDYTILYAFSGELGAYPDGRLVLSGPTLYGTTAWGGVIGYGTVFQIGTDGSGFATLKHFTWDDGAEVRTGLALAGGALFGVAASGGSTEGGGVLFSMSLAPDRPAIQLQPKSESVLVGTWATFRVLASGLPSVSYQWFRGGTNALPGATNALLQLPDVTTAQAGAYQVVISNASGSVTSNPAILTVLDPAISSLSLTSMADYGTEVEFVVEPYGTQPFGIQWWKDGVRLKDSANVSGAQSPALHLTSVSGAASGLYSVVISNASGSITSEPSLFLVSDPKVVTEPFDVRVNAGETAEFSVAGIGTGPLRYQWFRNGTPLSNGSRISGVATDTLHIEPVTTADAGMYSVSLENTYGQVAPAPARLVVNAIFADGFATAVDETIVALLPLPSSAPIGDVLIAGGFSTVGGQSRSNLARIQPTGGVDPAFAPAANDWVTSLAPRANGGWLVGGWFTRCAGELRDRLAAFDANGNLDSSVAPATDGRVNCLAVQPDGAILLGGEFTQVNGVARQHLARLRPDLTLDPAFNPGADAPVLCLALQPDGRILAGGDFASLGGQPRSRLGRLQADGSVDEAFGGEADGPVQAIVVRPDGRIVVGGSFFRLGGKACSRLGQLKADGSLETSLGQGANDAVLALALQADGRLIVSGWFTYLRGEPRSYLGRLQADGSLDRAFDPGADSMVAPLTLLADGSVLAAGSFGTLAGQPRLHLGRLTNSVVATQQLATAGSTVKWTRGGSVPEIWRAELEVSGNGTTWSKVGAGTRVAGGWEWTGLTLPARATLRARGWVASGGGSTWIVESSSGPPGVTAQPLDTRAPMGGTASLRVEAAGTSSLGFQWFRGATRLQDSPTIQGARTPGLFLTGLSETDAGLYSVVVSNALGSVTSRLARVTVENPFLVSRPDVRTVDAGDRVVVTALAGGTSPLEYRWRKEGVPLTDGGAISGSSSPTLTIDPVLGADAGSYSVVVQNAFGSVTGLVVTLAVRDPVVRTPPASQSLQLGQELRLTVVAGGTAPFAYEWRRNDAPIVGATGPSYVVPAAAGSDSGGYAVVVRNGFGSVTSQLAQVTVNVAAVDPSFQPNLAGSVASLAFQADGNLLAGGPFVCFEGALTRTYAARFLPTGALDPSFNAAPSGLVRTIVSQPDHRILIGGDFSSVHGLPRPFLARLNSDGWPETGELAAPNQLVNAIALEPEGRFVAGGAFSNVGGTWRRSLARWNADGTLDGGFAVDAAGDVRCLMRLSDGRFLVGGDFGALGGQPVRYFGRIHADGLIDSTFQPNPDGSVLAIALQPDGGILIGGNFFTVGGIPRSGLARVLPDGSLDRGWNPAPNQPVLAIVVQPDGRVIIGGYFDQVAGQPRARLARLLPDGTLDPTFNPGADGPVLALALSSSGQLAVGGQFMELGGQRRLYLARLNLQDPPALVEFSSSQTAEVGDTVQFRARASGYPPLSFEFRRNGVPVLPPRTNATLSLNGIDLAQAGSYTVTVSNRYGQVTSSPAMLQVVPPVPRGLYPRLTMTGDPGAAWRLEASPRPEPSAPWAVLAEGFIEGISSTYVDFADDLPSQRFYRVAWAAIPSFPAAISLQPVPVLTVTGSPGSRWRIDAIPRFGPVDAWSTIADITLTHPSQWVVDSAAVGLPPRVYRLVPQP